MKLLSRSFCQVVLLCPVLLIASCATQSSKHAAAADVELRFYRWDSIYIAKPVVRENGFATVFDTSGALAHLQQLTTGRDVAAVVVGLNYDTQQTRDIGAQWFAKLAPLGFQRVIVFRGTEQWPIAKLPIVYDSAISSVNDTRGLSRPNAQAPSAPRADAAHPSIAAIR
ncbi:MAG: hypothetical protein QM813_24265 [Verrucomicrobiota bacterium]